MLLSVVGICLLSLEPESREVCIFKQKGISLHVSSKLQSTHSCLGSPLRGENTKDRPGAKSASLEPWRVPALPKKNQGKHPGSEKQQEQPRKSSRAKGLVRGSSAQQCRGGHQQAHPKPFQGWGQENKWSQHNIYLNILKL